jgi:hypothetical protein
MKSHPFFAVNFAFVTTIAVAAPSYYFCYRRREHKEATIELMMKANDFQHQEEMPEPVPQSQHPFLDTSHNTNGLADGSSNSSDSNELIQQKEFVARLKEKKEWQKQEPMDDASNVFKEVKKGR